MRKQNLGCALSVGLLLAVTPAFSTSAKPPAGSAPVAQGPILDPRTGSYFELRIDNFRPVPGGHDNARWEDAVRRATSHIYKGLRGRLAIVDDAETLDFIRQNFRINQETWIGLRYFCKYRTLMSVNGEVLPRAKKQFWAHPWYRNRTILCSNQNMEYMPVYLTREGSSPVLWRAVGWKKYFVSYLIEYPAPPKNKNQSETHAAARRAPPQ